MADLIAIREMRVGLVIDLGCARSYGFARSGRVEAAGWDWAVVRTDQGSVELLTGEASFVEYVDVGIET